MSQIQPDPTPGDTSWFTHDRFGMFIHWGPAMMLQDGEWVMENKRIPIAEYEGLAPLFNPVKFDADAWVRFAQALTLATRLLAA